ncbi:unnamed protein product [Phaeothamnion confervicola]
MLKGDVDIDFRMPSEFQEQRRAAQEVSDTGGRPRPSLHQSGGSAFLFMCQEYRLPMHIIVLLFFHRRLLQSPPFPSGNDQSIPARRFRAAGRVAGADGWGRETGQLPDVWKRRQAAHRGGGPAGRQRQLQEDDGLAQHAASPGGGGRGGDYARHDRLQPPPREKEPAVVPRAQRSGPQVDECLFGDGAAALGHLPFRAGAHAREVPGVRAGLRRADRRRALAREFGGRLAVTKWTVLRRQSRFWGCCSAGRGDVALRRCAAPILILLS